jgi:hypothetical protein
LTCAHRQIRVGFWSRGSGEETNHMALTTVRAREHLGGLVWTGRVPASLGSFGSGFVLLNDAGGDASAVADRDALLFGPRPDIAAALTA